MPLENIIDRYIGLGGWQEQVIHYMLSLLICHMLIHHIINSYVTLLTFGKYPNSFDEMFPLLFLHKLLHHLLH